MHFLFVSFVLFYIETIPYVQYLSLDIVTYSEGACSFSTSFFFLSLPSLLCDFDTLAMYRARHPYAMRTTVIAYATSIQIQNTC